MANQNMQRPKPEKPPEKTDRPALSAEKADAQRKWDIIDEHAWESFPASDSPSSWAGRDLTPEELEERAKEQKAKSD